MLPWNRIVAKLANTFRPARADADLRREIDSHLALMEERFEERGLTPAEARREARREYGNVTQVQELHREERSFLWIEQAVQDTRYALRGFRKSKMFAGIAMVTVALGIGANAVIFSIVKTVLLHPLPYQDPERLVAIPADHMGGLTIVSVPKLQAVQSQNQSLERLGAFYPVAMNLTLRGVPEQVPGSHVSFDFFPLMGVMPALGRGFLPEEDRPGGKDVALVSDGFWRRRMNSDPDLAGKTMPIDGRNTTVIGVLPATFRFPFFQPEVEVWLPRVFENPIYTPERIQAGAAYLFVLGKVKPGQSVERVGTELKTIATRYGHEFANNADAAAGLAVAPLESFLVANIKPSLLALLAAVGFVLLIACANVANLLLARATSRGKEFGVRRALGAGRGRLIRQLLTETLVLSLLGGALGLGLAAWGLRPLMSFVPPGAIPLSDAVRLDWTVLLICFAACCVTGALFGLMPARDASRRDLIEKLKEGGRGSTAGRGRLRQWLVIAEVALTLMLMIGAGLLIKSMLNLMRVSPGFVADGVTTFFLNLPKTQYPKPEQRAEFWRQLVDRVGTLPGIQSAGIVSHLPLGQGGRFIHFCPQGTPCQGLARDPITAWRQVSPHFFLTMRTPLIRGRAFDEHDRADSPLVVIVNQTIADRYFAGTDPVGRQIMNSREQSQMKIVGVVADVKFTTLNGPNAEEIYVPYTQSPWPSMSLVVRTQSGLAAPVEGVRQVVARMDPELPLAAIARMDQVVSASIAQPRLIAGIIGVFALAALFLASVGIYGVMAYLVTQRSPEIAIRMALGAQRGTIFRLMIGQGMRLVGAGIVLGMGLSLGLTRLLSTLLFGTTPTDVVTIGAVSVLFGLVALGACYLPSRRAMRLNALAALRCI